MSQSPHPDPPAPRRWWPLPLAMAGGLFPLFWWTRAGWQSGDALAYLVAARDGVDLFHPHHLLYSPVVRWVHLALGVDVLQAAQLHGTAWGVAGAVLLFLTVRSMTTDGWLASVAACGMAVTQGFWLLTTQANSYVPALACLIGVAWLLTRSRDRGPSAPELLGMAALWALATLYHQLHVLFGVPLLIYLVWIRGCGVWRPVRLVVIPAGLLVAGSYLLAFVASVSEPGWDAWLEFAFRYARYPNPTWGTLGNLAPAGMLTLLVNQLWNLLAVPPARATIPALAFGALAGVMIVWNVRAARGRRHDAGIRLFLLCWLGVYLAFCGWWLPAHKPLFLNTVPALLLLGLLLLVDGTNGATDRDGARRRLRFVLLTLVLAVGGFHLAVVVWPAHTTIHPAREEARELDRALAAEAQVLASYEIAQSLRYYHQRSAAAHARYPLLCLYDGREIPAEAQIRDDRPLWIDLGYLRPDLDVFGRDGFHNPVPWRAYLEWVLAVETDAAGAPVACREFEVIRTASGRRYLRVGADRRAVDGMRTLCADLDRAAGGDFFTRWAAAAEGTS